MNYSFAIRLLLPVVVLAHSALYAQEVGDRDREIAAMIVDHEAASIRLREELKAAGDDADAQTAVRERYSSQRFARRFMQFATAGNDAASLEACRYVIKNFYLVNERHDAIRYVTAHHFDKPRIAEFFLELVHGYALDLSADDCLKAGTKAQRTATRAHATYQLARLQISRRDGCLDNPAERMLYEETFEKEWVERLLSSEGLKEIEKLLMTVRDSFPDEKYFDYSLKDRATQELFALQHLEIGCETPIVTGMDSGGMTFSLKDYRGKVVVVCFWAHWCGPCMDSLPEETAFVRNMAGRPFVWLGVNGDEDAKLLQKAEKDSTVNFRSWHDGMEGPIALQWHVWGWPAVYVIDHDGIIQYKSRKAVNLKQVFAAAEDLTRKVETKRK